MAQKQHEWHQHFIDEIDWVNICEYLKTLNQSQIKRLGGHLGLYSSTVTHMNTLPDDMVRAWLRKQDDVIKKCGRNLTWNVLVKALQTMNQTGIADLILKERCVHKASESSNKSPAAATSGAGLGAQEKDEELDSYPLPRDPGSEASNGQDPNSQDIKMDILCMPEEANDAKPLLAHQTNCQAETEQSKERSEAVYPKIERTLSSPCANGSQLQRNSGILENVYQPSNQPSTFSESVEVERDGVTEDATKDTLLPITSKDETSTSVNGDIIEKVSRPPSVMTTTSSNLENDETDQPATEENHTPPPTTKNVQNTTVARSINVDIVEEYTTLPATTMAQPNANNTDPKQKLQNPRFSCRSKCSTPTFVCCILVFALLATAIIAGPGDLGVYLENSHQLQKQVVLGHDNDTIIVGKVTGLFVGKVNISEHLEENDYSHISRIYVTHSLVHCKRELKGGMERTYQADHTQFTGLLDYIYLLKGSVINYTMCVASVTESSDGLNGNFYIFDDLMDYRDYATDRAVYHHVLQFGTNNKTVCWPLKSWVVSKTGYYFIMSQTPGNIVYEYHYNIQQVYLDQNDYNEAIKECPEGVYEPYSCVVRVKRGDYVLAHIVLPVAADPMTTHLRLQPMSLSVLKIVMIVAVCVFGVCFLAFFVLLVYAINRWYKRRRYTTGGYMPLSYL